MKIPNDRTEGKITCVLEDVIKHDVKLDLLTVYAASVVSSGFGKGSCWYYGKDTAATFSHRRLFICRDMGQVSYDSTNKIAFQYSIYNTPGGQAPDMVTTTNNNKNFPANTELLNVITH